MVIQSAMLKKTLRNNFGVILGVSLHDKAISIMSIHILTKFGKVQEQAVC